MLQLGEEEVDEVMDGRIEARDVAQIAFIALHLLPIITPVSYTHLFAVAVGPYTSGSGGDSGMWLIPYAGMTVSQSFTLIRTCLLYTSHVKDPERKALKDSTFSDFCESTQR